MANLKCHVYHCAYNDCTHCRHENPDVDEHANCESFVRKTDAQLKSENLYEYADDMSFSLHDDDHYIKCKSCSCAVNFKEVCKSNNVRIDLSNDQAKCMNYREDDI